MRRTKEALITQQQNLNREKGRGPEFAFYFSKVPKGSVLQLSLVAIVFAVLLFAVPAFLPDFGKVLYRNKVVQSVEKFELTNEVFKGLFKGTTHSGDTRPNAEATFMAVSILTSNSDTPRSRIKNEDKTQQYVNQLESNDFNKNTQEIYYGIVQLKGLGLLKEGSVSQQYADKYYNMLLALTERHSAFRLNASRSASVSATYYAFEAIKELGKMEAFKKADEFNSAIHFVASMKDPQSGGFRESPGENATILATWHAVQILSEKDAKTSEHVSKAYENLDGFVFSCQAKDGGFSDTPLTDLEDLYFTESSMVTSVQGLYILEFLKAQELVSFAFADAETTLHSEAVSYVRACLSLQLGVVGQYPGKETDLAATYFFLKLVDEYPTIVYGIPRSLQVFFVALGFLLLGYAVFNYYKPQLNTKIVQKIQSEAKRSLLILGLAAIALQTFPTFAILFYLAFVTYLSIRLYEIISTDNTDGYISIIGAAHSLGFMVLVFAFLYSSPLIFVNLRVFYVLALWGTLIVGGATLGACYMTGITKLQFYLDAAFVGWVSNTIIFYGMLYGRGEMEAVYRLVVVHGHFYAVFVFLPVMALILAYAAAGIGAAVYLTFARQKAEALRRKRAAAAKNEAAKKAPAPLLLKNIDE